MRASGILLHISSLLSPYGIGTFGKSAYHFVDFLKEAKQKYWQVLPLGSTSIGDSPYQSFSAFGGNPYFIDLDLLKEQGLINEFTLNALNSDNEKVDYEFLFKTRFIVLFEAFRSFKQSDQSEFLQFKEEQADWLNDYALFMSLKEYHHHKAWWEWEEGYKIRDMEKLYHFQNNYAERIDFWKFVQYLFFQQFHALKAYINASGIKLIGDIPIYVAHDSADIWANPKEWQLDEELNLLAMAGCPPDRFSLKGQLWGNPLYDYQAMEANNFAWWIKRIKASFALYDVIRIDHFRGFEAYFKIPAGDIPINGKWVKGPGLRFFNAIKASLGELMIIAEDLGHITDEVRNLLDATAFPGMKVLQFAFDGKSDNPYLPHNHVENSIVYPGTHDNQTILAWYHSLDEEQKLYVLDYLCLDDDEKIADQLIKTCLASVAKLAIIPMQDYLGLNDEARYNTPSTIGGNWQWRLNENWQSDELIQRIANWTKLYGR